MKKEKSSKKAIIIGASSGIGKALAYELSKNGYTLGLVSRRKELLKDLQKELASPVYIKKIDVTNENAPDLLFDLINEMKEVDLIVINAGVGFSDSNKEWIEDIFTWEKEKITLLTNVYGFTAMTLAAYHYFLKRKKGHIVGVSSIASLIPNSYTPAYSASKAYISNYLEGLRIHAYKSHLPITITDILPGWVYTPMTVRNEKMFWVASVDLAAKQILDAIKNKKNRAYITKRWALVPLFLKMIPRFLYKKIF